MCSSYKIAFLPMQEGSRTRHEKIEWNIESARDLDARIQNKQYLDDDKRLEKKRQILQKMYDRNEKKKVAKKVGEKYKKILTVDNATEIAIKNQNEYEKNKARNHKTNIQFPTPQSTIRLTNRTEKQNKPVRPKTTSVTQSNRCKTAGVHRKSSHGELKVGELDKHNPRSGRVGEDLLEQMRNLATSDDKNIKNNNHQPNAMEKYMKMKAERDADPNVKE